MNRVEALDKVTGRARYAYEQRAPRPAAYAFPVQSPTARGFVRTVDAGRARAMPGVLAVLSCTEPPELGSAEDPELAVLDLRSVRTAEQAAAICERIVDTGVLDVARSRARDLVAEAKQGLPAMPGRQRAALELAADVMVERYA